MNMNLLPLVNKARRIYDLNNVPLVHGHSHVKWHLPHSIHSEHRGRTPKSPIANHRVEYNYGRLVPVRVGIDKAGSLSECPIEFEVIQEFSLPSAAAGGAAGPTRDEKITLGRLTLNLAEYVDESEAVLRDTGYRARAPGTAPAAGASSSAAAAAAVAVTAAAAGGHGRKRSSLSIHTPADATSSPKSTSTPDSRSSLSKDTPPPSNSGGGGNNSSSNNNNNNNNNKTPSINEPVPSGPEAQPVEDGIVRRYLMTDSKINSTLKIGILMVQLEGERNFVAPPLKTAAVFGGIAGMASGAGGAGGSSSSSSSGPRHLTVEDLGQHFQDPADPGAPFPTARGRAGSVAARDVHELHDMYRRTLAASWACQPGELPADECIEDIFQGGDGFDPDAAIAPGDGAADADGLGGDVTPRGPRSRGPRAAGRTTTTTTGGGSPLRRGVVRREDSGSSSATGEAGGDLLRPGPPPPPSPRRASAGGGPGGRRHHGRHGSGESNTTTTTTTNNNNNNNNTHRHDGAHWGSGGGHQHQQHHHGRMGHRRDSSKDSASSRGGGMVGLRSRSGSLASLAGTIEMERSRSGFKSAREVREWEVRDDLVAWKLPGTAS